MKRAKKSLVILSVCGVLAVTAAFLLGAITGGENGAETEVEYELLFEISRFNLRII